MRVRVVWCLDALICRWQRHRYPLGLNRLRLAQHWTGWGLTGPVVSPHPVQRDGPSLGSGLPGLLSGHYLS